MPRPPLLNTIDWPAIHGTGKDYAQWIADAEEPAKREAMEEGLRTMTLDPALDAWLAALPRLVHVVAIAEDWCGDVVRHVPVLQCLAQAAPNLRVRYISRAQHLDVFSRFLTNGGESIPIFIFLNDQYVECGHWGPMPAALREVIARGKACGDIKTARERVSALYAADPDRREVVRELVRLIDIAASTRP